MQFLVIRKYNRDAEALRHSSHPEHRKFINLVQARILHGARLLDENESPVGSAVVYLGDDRADVEKLIAADPYHKNGVYLSSELFEFCQSIKDGTRIS